MAVPTITSIDPASGRTLGNALIKIVGTGFSPDGVRVEFDGVAGVNPFGFGTVDVYVRTPQADVGPVDVTVQNLDAAGDDIGGEAVTAAAGYTFARRDLAGSSRIARTVGALVALFRRHVLENTHARQGPDWYDADAGVEIVPLEETPLIVLTGPQVEEDIHYGRTRRSSDAGGSLTSESTFVTVNRLEFGVWASAESNIQLYNLAHALEELLTQITSIDVQRTANPADGLATHRIEPVGGMKIMPRDDKTSGAGALSWAIRIRGVPADLGSEVGIASEVLTIDLIKEGLPP